MYMFFISVLLFESSRVEVGVVSELGGGNTIPPLVNITFERSPRFCERDLAITQRVFPAVKLPLPAVEVTFSGVENMRPFVASLFVRMHVGLPLFFK